MPHEPALVGGRLGEADLLEPVEGVRAAVTGLYAFTVR